MNRTGPLTTPGNDFLQFLSLHMYSDLADSIHGQAAAGNVSLSLPLDAPAEVVRGYQALYHSLTERLLSNSTAMLEVIWADGTLVLVLQHPYSRGFIKASSSNAFDAPIRDAGLLRNPLDVALLREAIRFGRRLLMTDELSRLSPSELLPGVNITSNQGLDDFIRQGAETIAHPVGSCKMGPREQGGVVDKELKVYSVEGLRIVDASVMPAIPAAHTMATVYAVASKAGDMIVDSLPSQNSFGRGQRPGYGYD